MSPDRLVRNSEVQAFKTCRWRWYQTYIEGRRAIDAAPALRFGDVIHRALEAYYKPGRRRGPHPAKTAAKIIDDEGDFRVWDDDAEEGVTAKQLALAMLEGYVDRYRHEDRAWEVIASERTFKYAIRVPVLFGRGTRRVKVVGTMDGLWRRIEDGRLAFKEFKTAKSISTDALALDEQPSMYWTYGTAYLRKAGVIGPEDEPSQILYTFLRKAEPDDRPRDEHGRALNKDGSVSKRQQPDLFLRTPVYRDPADRKQLHRRVGATISEMMAAEKGELMSYKTPGPLHNPNCRGCPVREMCELHEAGADWTGFRDMTTEPWDPYAAHELVERR